jgi:hypothetical protein
MSRLRNFSADVWVMIQPRSAFAALVRQPAGRGIWLAAKRPLFLAFLIGCTISLVTSPGLNLRLAAGGTVCWSFVPLAGIAALIAVCGRKREGLSLARTIDLFFTGAGPWAAWLIGLCAIWSFLPPARAFAFSNPFWLYGGAAVAIVWSAWIDFRFFRLVLGRGRVGAWGGLLLQRLISWSLVILIFGAPSIPPEIAARLKL